MENAPVQILRKQIDVPDGFRETYVNRAFIADPAAFERGVQILCVAEVPDNYVAEVTRIEAGVFACLNPASPAPTISQLDQLHWWAHFSDQHAPIPFPPPLPPIDWTLIFLQSSGPFDDQNLAPPNGTIFPVPLNALTLFPFGDAERLWPDARTGLISYAPHKIVVGPRQFGIVTAWNQPAPAGPFALPYQFAQSWGVMEWRALRYDSPEARRLVLGGLT